MPVLYVNVGVLGVLAKMELTKTGPTKMEPIRAKRALDAALGKYIDEAIRRVKDKDYDTLMTKAANKEDAKTKTDKPKEVRTSILSLPSSLNPFGQKRAKSPTNEWTDDEQELIKAIKSVIVAYVKINLAYETDKTDESGLKVTEPSYFRSRDPKAKISKEERTALFNKVTDYITATFKPGYVKREAIDYSEKEIVGKSVATLTNPLVYSVAKVLNAKALREETPPATPPTWFITPDAGIPLALGDNAYTNNYKPMVDEMFAILTAKNVLFKKSSGLVGLDQVCELILKHPKSGDRTFRISTSDDASLETIKDLITQAITDYPEIVGLLSETNQDLLNAFVNPDATNVNHDEWDYYTSPPDDSHRNQAMPHYSMMSSMPEFNINDRNIFDVINDSGTPTPTPDDETASTNSDHAPFSEPGLFDENPHIPDSGQNPFDVVNADSSWNIADLIKNLDALGLETYEYEVAANQSEFNQAEHHVIEKTITSDTDDNKVAVWNDVFTLDEDHSFKAEIEKFYNKDGENYLTCLLVTEGSADPVRYNVATIENGIITCDDLVQFARQEDGSWGWNELETPHQPSSPKNQ